MARLDELFDVRNGLASNQLSVSKARTPTSIPYLRPAKTQQRTVAGWVERVSVPQDHCYPKHTIFVSTNGEGSHTYAYVSDFDFAANSDVSILIPKRLMSLAEKLFYVRAITLNRPKFSYGRKPKGDRLKAIELPDHVPAWVLNTSLENPEFQFQSDVGDSSKEVRRKPRQNGHACIRLEDLFDVQYGTNLELNKLSINHNGVNFVARTSQNNGVSAKVQRLYDINPTEGMVLTVAGGGSVLETFLQIEPFYSGRDLYFLRPKISMSVDEMLYYATCIKANQYKYSYGRQANKTLRDLLIPAFECVPEWVHGTLHRISTQVKANAVTLT